MAAKPMPTTLRKDVSMLTPVPTKRWKRSPAADLAKSAPATAADPLDVTMEFVPEASPSARLAAMLRRTTLRAHEALRGGRPDPQALRAIISEIDDLETEVERLGLRNLRAFVGSLRRRIEAGL